MNVEKEGRRGGTYRGRHIPVDGIIEVDGGAVVDLAARGCARVQRIGARESRVAGIPLNKVIQPIRACEGARLEPEIARGLIIESVEKGNPEHMH